MTRHAFLDEAGLIRTVEQNGHRIRYQGPHLSLKVSPSVKLPENTGRVIFIALKNGVVWGLFIPGSEHLHIFLLFPMSDLNMRT